MKLEKQAFGTSVPLGFWFQYCSIIVCVFWVCLFFFNVETAFPVLECYQWFVETLNSYSAGCVFVFVCVRDKETEQEREFQNTS